MAMRLMVAGGAFAGAAFLGGAFFGFRGAVIFSVVAFLFVFFTTKKN